MIDIFYIISFIMWIGFALLNLSICRWYYEKLQLCSIKKNQLKIFNILSAMLMIVSVILSFLIYLNIIWLKYFMLTVAFFVGTISYYDQYIYNRKKATKTWWKEWNIFDKIIIIALIAISICMVSYNASVRSVFILIGANIFAGYILFVKKIRKQRKILNLFSNKYINLIVRLPIDLFYYLCCTVLIIYIISATTNLTHLRIDPPDTDGCMDTGICKEGTKFDNCSAGELCIITKENCIKHNNIWLENIRSCNIREHR